MGESTQSELKALTREFPSTGNNAKERGRDEVTMGVLSFRWDSPTKEAQQKRDYDQKPREGGWERDTSGPRRVGA